jgi:hypothetical protein
MTFFAAPPPAVREGFEGVKELIGPDQFSSHRSRGSAVREGFRLLGVALFFISRGYAALAIDSGAQ